MRLRKTPMSDAARLPVTLPLFRLAHDLRHPLRVIMAKVYEMRRLDSQHFHEKASGLLDEIVRAAEAQDRLLAAAVEFESASEAGLGGALRPLDIVIRAACLSVEAFRKERDGEIHAAEAGSAPVPAVVERILAKVLHNALKFHAAGSVPSVSLEATLTDDYWRIRVADRGIGVDARYRQRIFEPFGKLNADAAFPGAGLGLATAKRWIESIGGSISVTGPESDTDPGSVFLLQFPVDPVQ